MNMFNMKIHSGMTLNERLFASGLMGQLDKAVEARDKELFIKILRDVEMEQDAAEKAVVAIFANPEKYGFKNNP